MRTGAAGKAARRQRALERQRAAQKAAEPPPKTPKLRVPGNAAEALEMAAELGWEAERRRDGYRLTHPSGATAMLHLTVSDKRAWRNLRADLLRAVQEKVS